MAKDKDLGSISGLPEELGIDEDLGRTQQHLTIRKDTRRYGKAVTVVEGFDPDVTDLGEVASELKSKLACGGTVEGEEIELQGDHVARVGDVLREMGYDVDA
ncbi:MAG: stress response translation initiation inhibitor YciH [Salinigranum sp.]